MSKPLCAVTGASGGIGTALAWRAARQGYDLVLHGRSRESLSALRDALQRSDSALSIELVVGDLDTALAAQRVAEGIAEVAGHLDLLFNNAGVLVDGIQLSPDGLELHTQVNLIAPFILMEKLRPSVARTQGAIVNVSSGAALKARTLSVHELRRPTRAKKLFGAYANSKLALSAVTNWLGESYAEDGIAMISADPGPNKTTMTAGPGMPGFVRLLRPFLHGSPDRGARHLFDALAQARVMAPGTFFTKGRATRLPSLAYEAIAVEPVLELCRAQSGSLQYHDLSNPRGVQE